jgi:hypothetical protein
LSAFFSLFSVLVEAPGRVLDTGLGAALGARLDLLDEPDVIEL